MLSARILSQPLNFQELSENLKKNNLLAHIRPEGLSLLQRVYPTYNINNNEFNLLQHKVSLVNGNVKVGI